MTWPAKKPAGLDASEKTSFGKGVFRKCDGCAETLTAEALEQNFEVCPQCGRAPPAPRDRLARPDPRRRRCSTSGTRTSSPTDPLGFTDGRGYPERVATSQKATRTKEAIETGKGHLDGMPVAYGAFIFAFMGGSMGSVVGEKIARLFERGAEQRLPVVLLQASGGARMQEGILSLMQMAKTVAARERLRDAGLPFISVLLDPTTGGVAASFAFLGDVNIAEPEALIGFAGAARHRERPSARSCPRASSAASSCSSTG